MEDIDQTSSMTRRRIVSICAAFAALLPLAACAPERKAKPSKPRLPKCPDTTAKRGGYAARATHLGVRLSSPIDVVSFWVEADVSRDKYRAGIIYRTTVHPDGTVRDATATLNFAGQPNLRVTAPLGYSITETSPDLPYGYAMPLDADQSRRLYRSVRDAKQATLSVVQGGRRLGRVRLQLTDAHRLLFDANLQHELSAEKKAAGECRGCFVTTACCEAVGLADDCWELTVARRFRDGWLSRQTGGVEVIQDYYDAAPDVVAHVAALPDARRRFLTLYAFRILPFCVLSSLGAKRWAFGLYRRTVQRLLREAGADSAAPHLATAVREG